jgi:transposase
VGYIPNVSVSFTEDEENFNRDTYMFKSLLPIKKTNSYTQLNNQTESAYIDYDIQQEIYKEKCLNDYLREDIRYEEESIPV